ncbi:MAG: NAD(P)H-hydrate dehydratase [Armatimonadota bacterium]|nr:NAD(P)H-hydrate dehydratase [Armatimonadota bacterium]MDR7574084.1 NAD(P)H-hydrate dehydratase [Armatimonadota bacterium]
MRAVTSAQIAELDRRATEEYGIAVPQLMEAAGRWVAQAARELLGDGRGRVVVLAGKGNNGGDGLVAARHLAAAGTAVTALLVAPESEYAGEAGRTLAEAKSSGVEVRVAASEALPALLGEAALIIDALFGTGFRGPARGLAAEVIQAANRSGRPILAVDVPSGLNADTGVADGPVIRAAATVTMGLPKVGLLTYPGADLAGTIYVADIGYPGALADDVSIRTHLVTPEMVRARIPPRPRDSHKGTYGRTLIVAGSVGFTGAAVLAALGALRAGAGLVTLGVPADVYPIIASHVVEAMPTPLPARHGALSAEARIRIDELAAISEAVAVGPGLSTAPGVREVVVGLLQSGRPLVIDADGLNVLAGEAEVLRTAAGPVVITPHPGELARLVGRRTAEITQDRLGSAREAADRLRCVVVLKSASTVVAAPEGDAYIVRTGNPGMATGGMGDVLTGAVASLIGQGVSPTEAAWAGAYLHGLAADLLAEERGMVGMLASEVAHRLPQAIQRVRTGTAPEPIRILTG